MKKKTAKRGLAAGSKLPAKLPTKATKKPARAAGKDAETVAPGNPFTIYLRGLRQPMTAAREVCGGSAEEALRTVLNENVEGIDEPVIIWEDNGRLVALDFDRPENGRSLRAEDLEKLATSCEIKPLCGWLTHGGGVRLIFTENAKRGITALELAGAFLLRAPLNSVTGWSLEIKTETRHPSGLREKKKCGGVFWWSNLEEGIAFQKRRFISSVGDQEIKAWLEKRGMALDHRHSHEFCPFNPYAISGNDPVVIYEDRIHCFRCEQEGEKCSASFAELIEGADAGPGLKDTFLLAANELVHIGHQQHVIKAYLNSKLSSFPPYLIAPAWCGFLKLVHRPQSAGNPVLKPILNALDPRHFKFARTVSGGWVYSESGRSFPVSKETLKSMPWCNGSSERADRAMSDLPLDGFVGLEIFSKSRVLHPSWKPAAGTVLAHFQADADEPPPLNLGMAPPSEAEVQMAMRALSKLLPGINLCYLCAAILMQIQATIPAGTPPLLVVTGPPGSGKSATMQLAAAAVGGGVAGLNFSCNDLKQEIGTALEDGASILLFDEIGRTAYAYRKLAGILSLNEKERFARKYQQQRFVKVNAAVALVGSTLPKPVFGPEVARRGVGYALSDVVDRWVTRFPALSMARSCPELRAALDILTRAVWWDMKQNPDMTWRELCFQKFAAIPIDELAADHVSIEARNEAICELYEMFRTAPEDGMSDRKKYRGYMNAFGDTEAHNHLEVLIDPDADKDEIAADIEEIQRLNLAPILGFSSPALKLQVYKRNEFFIFRFLQTGVKRGFETRREDLPRISPRKADFP